MLVLTSTYHHLYLNVTFRAYCFFFFNDTATTEIYTLSLHDALPILWPARPRRRQIALPMPPMPPETKAMRDTAGMDRSEEHTSELQSQSNLVCRLLLEKKKIKTMLT